MHAGNPGGLFQAPSNEQLRRLLYIALGLDHWPHALRYHGRHGVSRFQGHAPFFHPLQGRHPTIGEGAYCRNWSFYEQRSFGDGRSMRYEVLGLYGISGVIAAPAQNVESPLFFTVLMRVPAIFLDTGATIADCLLF